MLILFLRVHQGSSRRRHFIDGALRIVDDSSQPTDDGRAVVIADLPSLTPGDFIQRFHAII